VTDDHSVELFTVAFDIDKTGDAKAKVGDSVTYTYTLTNGSSGNAPELTCTATDSNTALARAAWSGVRGAAGGGATTTATYTVQATDANPLLNTVTLHCALPGPTPTPDGRDGRPLGGALHGGVRHRQDG